MKKVGLPVINNQRGNLVASNCFRLYAFSERVDGKNNRFEEENRAAALYFAEGLKALHKGYFAANNLVLGGGEEAVAEKVTTTLSPLSRNYTQKALAYFGQALAAKPNYFCARAAFKRTAEILGDFDLAEKEEYSLQMSDSPHHGEGLCHLMHPGFYSASDLSGLEESLKEGKK